MRDWHIVRDSRTERPAVLDDSSSVTTVYERRNIRQETVTVDAGREPTAEWVYEQRELTREEYAQMQSPATQSVMQTLSGLELSIAMMEGGMV